MNLESHQGVCCEYDIIIVLVAATPSSGIPMRGARWNTVSVKSRIQAHFCRVV